MRLAALTAALMVPSLALAHDGPLGHAHPYGLELALLAGSALLLWRWAR